jgi:hypothetical protein
MLMGAVYNAEVVCKFVETVACTFKQNFVIVVVSYYRVVIVDFVLKTL